MSNEEMLIVSRVRIQVEMDTLRFTGDVSMTRMFPNWLPACNAWSRLGLDLGAGEP